jgi:hypothetical protein
MACPRSDKQHRLVVHAALEKLDKIGCKPFSLRRARHNMAFLADLNENAFQGFQVRRIQGGSMFMRSIMPVPPSCQIKGRKIRLPVKSVI